MLVNEAAKKLRHESTNITVSTTTTVISVWCSRKNV